MLLRFDPFRELDRVSEETGGAPWRAATTPAVPMDAVRRGETVEVHFDLPGVDPDSIDLEVERNVLTLRAHRQLQRQEDEQVLANERRHGSFSRQLFLGETLDANRVEASYDGGVLTVTIPMAEAAKARKVEVGTGGSSSASITTSSSESSGR